jgi:hypothetical protein
MSANRREGPVDNRPPSTREFLSHLKGVKRVKDGQRPEDEHEQELSPAMREWIRDCFVPLMVDEFLRQHANKPKAEGPQVTPVTEGSE